MTSMTMMITKMIRKVKPCHAPDHIDNDYNGWDDYDSDDVDDDDDLEIYFGHGNDVREDAMSLEAPEMASGARKSALDLVSYAKTTGLFNHSIHRRKITWRQLLNPSYSLCNCKMREEEKERIFKPVVALTWIPSEMKAATCPEVPKSIISWTSFAYLSPSDPKTPLYWSGLRAWCTPLWCMENKEEWSFSTSFDIVIIHTIWWYVYDDNAMQWW